MKHVTDPSYHLTKSSGLTKKNIAEASSGLNFIY